MDMNELLKDRYERAKILESSNMDEALNEYIKILDDATLEDAYILSNIGNILRKNGKAHNFVEKIKQYNYEDVKLRDYVNRSYLYALYSDKIQNYEYSEDSFNSFIETAEFIVDNSNQLDADQYIFNPYVLTVYKVIHILRTRAATNYYKELKWINKLNPDMLPDTPKQILASNGKEYEMASFKEFYYQVKTKCLEKIGRFSECIKCCEEALNIFEKFHYRNDLWFTARKLYCECLESGKEEDIQKYKQIAEKNNFWYMYHKLSEIYFSNGELESALHYSCKALLSDEFDAEKMINLLYDIAVLFENQHKFEKSKVFYGVTLFYRASFGWYIPEELRFAEKEYDLKRDYCPDDNKLKKYALDVLKEKENLHFGIVSKIVKDKKFGFIKYNNNCSMYFNLKRIKIKVQEKDKVYFTIINENDKLSAGCIYKVGGENVKNFNK